MPSTVDIRKRNIAHRLQLVVGTPASAIARPDKPIRTGNIVIYVIHLLSPEENARFAAYLDEISQPIADPVLLQKYYEGWVANSGYANYLVNYSVKPEDFAEPAPNRKLMPLRNLLTCEAHNDLLKTFMRLVEEGRVEEAKANLYKREF